MVLEIGKKKLDDKIHFPFPYKYNGKYNSQRRERT